MEKDTQSYRLKEISNLDNGDFGFSPSIKLVAGLEGSTKFMSISKDEFTRVCQVLTEDERDLYKVAVMNASMQMDSNFIDGFQASTALAICFMMPKEKTMIDLMEYRKDK